jgi:hypothetical protein
MKMRSIILRLVISVNKNLTGTAISHLILGAEEYIKTLILLNLSGDSCFSAMLDNIIYF